MNPAEPEPHVTGNPRGEADRIDQSASSGSGGPPGTPPQSPGRTRQKVAIGVVIAAVGLLGVILVMLVVTGERFEVGGCAYQDFGPDRLRPAACTDAKADYKVVAIVDDTAWSESRRACSGYPGATASYWQGQKGEKGTVYCLDPLS